MIASKVPSDREVTDWLIGLAFEPTKYKTKSGKLWKCKTTGKHIEIVDSIDGFRPDWQIHDIEDIIKKIRPPGFEFHF